MINDIILYTYIVISRFTIYTEKKTQIGVVLIVLNVIGNAVNIIICFYIFKLKLK